MTQDWKLNLISWVIENLIKTNTVSKKKKWYRNINQLESVFGVDLIISRVTVVIGGRCRRIKETELTLICCETLYRWTIKPNEWNYAHFRRPSQTLVFDDDGCCCWYDWSMVRTVNFTKIKTTCKRRHKFKLWIWIQWKNKWLVHFQYVSIQ